MKERTRWLVALIVAAVCCYAAGLLAGSKPYPRWTLTSYQEVPFGPACPPGQLCEVPTKLRVGILHDYLTGAQVAVIPGAGVAVIGYDKGPAAEER